MADERGELTAPGASYKARVVKMSADFLSTMLEGEEAKVAAGRVALAFRMMALRTPDLYQIPPEQIGYAIAMCAATNLAPGGALPDCWLIPRNMNVAGKNQPPKWIKALNWQISARGLVKLGQRAGWDLRAVPVFEGERFEAPRGLHEDIIHEPDYEQDIDDYARLRLFYVVAERPGHRPAFRIVTKAQIEKRRRLAETDMIWSKWPMEKAEQTAYGFSVRRGLVPIELIQIAVNATESEDQRIVVQAQVVEADAPAPAKKRGLGMAGIRAEIEAVDTVLFHTEDKPVAAEIRCANVVEEILGGERFAPIRWDDLLKRLQPAVTLDPGQNLSVLLEKAIVWGVRERGWTYNGSTYWLTDGVTPEPKAKLSPTQASVEAGLKAERDAADAVAAKPLSPEVQALMVSIEEWESSLGKERVKVVRDFEGVKRLDPRAPLDKLTKYRDALKAAGTKADKPAVVLMTDETRKAIEAVEAELPAALVDDRRAQLSAQTGKGTLGELTEAEAQAYLAAIGVSP